MAQNVLTFVLTNHTDNEFITAFYELDNFIDSANAVLILRVKYFKRILNTSDPDYKFRLVIHEGLGNRSSYNRSEAILSELEQAFPAINNNTLVYISRQQNLFQEQEQYIRDKMGIHLNFNKANSIEIEDLLPIYSVSDFTDNLIKQKKTFAETLEVKSPEKSDNDFAVLTALYEDEFSVYRAECHLASHDNVYNSYDATFKDKRPTPRGDDYQQQFMVIHQEEMGLVDAAMHSAEIISKIDPTFLLMSGVCGGRSGEVNLYDVIIPTTVHDYATGKFKEGKMELLGYKADARKELISFLKKRSADIILNMHSIIDPSRKKLLKPDFKIIIDEFACGPWVIKTGGFLDEYLVKNVNANIKGLEMESYGILRIGEVIQKSNRYSLVVKSVMDFTNEYKHDGEHGEVKSSAAYISYLCIRAMMPMLLEFKNDTIKKRKK